MTIDFKYSEGDFVTIVANPEMGEYEVSGLHCLGGSISYTINDGSEEFIKYEYQIKLSKSKNVKPRQIGFKERQEPKGTPIINQIGETKGIEVGE
jgi:hypothetical protein